MEEEGADLKSRGKKNRIATQSFSGSVACGEEPIRWSLHPHWFLELILSRVEFFCYALESHGCACCLLFVVSQCYCHFSIFIGSFLFQRAQPPQGTVIFINVLGKELTPRVCMGDGGSIWWVPAMAHLGRPSLIYSLIWLSWMFPRLRFALRPPKIGS